MNACCLQVVFIFILIFWSHQAFQGSIGVSYLQRRRQRIVQGYLLLGQSTLLKITNPFFFFFLNSLVICFTFSFHVHRAAQFIVKSCRDSEKSLWEQGGPDLPNLGLVTVPWNLFIFVDQFLRGTKEYRNLSKRGLILFKESRSRIWVSRNCQNSSVRYAENS